MNQPEFQDSCAILRVRIAKLQEQFRIANEELLKLQAQCSHDVDAMADRATRNDCRCGICGKVL